MTNTDTLLEEVEAMAQYNVSEGFARMQARLRQKKQRRLYSIGSGIAALAAAVMLFLWLPIGMISVTNPNNATLVHNLPDGSQVELNKEATLKYARHFEKNRSVTLKGEAFFDVKRNEQSPFVIKAGHSQVKVLGTSFNVYHNPANDRVEVLVKTGTVLLSYEDSYALELNAEEFGIAQDATLKMLPQQDPNYMAWKEHELHYDNSPLSYVAQTLEEAYHCKIHFSHDSLRQQGISTTFYHLSIDEIMTSISLTLDLKIEKEGEVYTISN